MLTPRGVLPLVYGPGQHPYHDLYHWHGAELVLGNAFVIAGLLLFGAMTTVAVLTRASGTSPPAGPVTAPPGPRRAGGAAEPLSVAGGGHDR